MFDLWFEFLFQYNVEYKKHINWGLVVFLVKYDRKLKKQAIRI